MNCQIELDLEEIDTLRWLIRSERRVQYMLLTESDGSLLKHLEDLYDKVSALIPNKSLGEV